MFTSIVKGLADHNPYLLSNKTSKLALGLRDLALNYIRYQSSQLSSFESSSSSEIPPLVKVVEYCSLLLEEWSESCTNTTSSGKILDKIYMYFLEVNDNISSDDIDHLGALSNVESFQTNLAETMVNICANTIECLEDLADFEYLWDAVLQDTETDVPTMFGHNNGGSIFCKVDGQPTTKNIHQIMEGNGDLLVTSKSIRQVAKELAWVCSLISMNDGDSDREQRIINSAACVDLVTASLMAPIVSAPAAKRRRLMSGDIEPQRSVEDEGAGALSTMLTGDCNSTYLREKAKKSLVQAASDLLSFTSSDTTQIQHKEIVSSAQKCASCMLPLLTADRRVNSARKYSPASHLLVFVSSHQLRQKNLLVLQNYYYNTISDKIRATLTNMPSTIGKSQRAFVVGKFIGNLQRTAFIDSVKAFSQLTFSERKLLAPFASTSSMASEAGGDSLSVTTMTYAPEPKPTTRHVIQISRVKNPPTSEAEAKDLNHWTTALFRIVSESSSIKPSPWLMNYLNPSITDSRMDGAWNTKVLPVLRYFLGIVANDCCLSDCTISDTGKCQVQRGHTLHALPSAVLMMYYLSLESIVRSSPLQYNMVHKAERFHSSLFSICYYCLSKAMQPEGQSFTIEDIGTCPIEFYKLVDLFIQVMKPSDSNSTEEGHTSLSLPSYLIQVLRQLQTMLLEMIWMSSNDLEVKIETSFIRMVSKLRETPSTWEQIFAVEENKKEKIMQGNNRMQVLVGFMLNNLTNVINRRINGLCTLLSLSSPTSTTEITMKLFNKILRDRTDLFYNRHPDQIMLCCLLVTLRAKSNNVHEENSFRHIANAYMKMHKDVLGSEIPYRILHRIKNCCSENDDEFGDIITLYNNVFLPTILPFWSSFKDGCLREEEIEASCKSPVLESALSQDDESMRDNKGDDNNVDDNVWKDEARNDGPCARNDDVATKESTFEDGTVDTVSIKAVDDRGDEEREETKPTDRVPVDNVGFTLPDHSDSSSSASLEEEELNNNADEVRLDDGMAEAGLQQNGTGRSDEVVVNNDTTSKNEGINGESSSSLAGVASPTSLDVIKGRGGYCLSHKGNIRFREVSTINMCLHYRMFISYSNLFLSHSYLFAYTHVT